MVDIMATTSEDYTKDDDYEDGELPEDGEIQDDEDTGPQESQKSSVGQSSGVSTPLPASSSPAPTTSPIQKKFAPKGYGDDTDVPNASRHMWGQSEGHGEYNYGNEDRDYRFQEEDFGDSDYRQGLPGRRGKRSPPMDDYDGPRGARGRPWRGAGFKKPKWATEHQICKFFREGYCRDGEQCTYSHQAEDSLRKPELCRFYANGYCKKGLTCLALHGEFPCIPYHKGECTAEHCRYSHLPLTEYTQPLYDQKVKEEEMGIHRGPPFPPNSHPTARRRVLLPHGPDGPASGPPQQLPPPPTIHAPLPQTSNGQLPPPTVVVPTIAPAVPHHPAYPQMPPRGSFFQSPAVPHQQSPHRIEEAPQPVVAPLVPAPTFDISSMLARIANENIVDDSPASPPMFGETSSEPVRSIPEAQEVSWRLIPVEVPRPYMGVDTNLPANDPRMSRIIASQFDAVSNLFAMEDPRMRDPRRRAEDKKTNDDRPRISSWMPQIA